MGSDPFSTFPTELVSMILGHLDDPRDLYSAIGASKHVEMEISPSSRELILHNIFRNAFGPIVLSDAIVAARLHRILYDSYQKCERRYLFLIQTMQEVKAQRNIKCRMHESSELCHIYPMLEYLITDCSTKFLSSAQQAIQNSSTQDSQIQTSSPSSPVNLSPLELSRLQRAFLRYIALQTPSYKPIHFGGRRSVTETQIASLLEEYEPWEREEIACVHEYIIGRLRDIFEEVEDYFVEDVIDKSLISHYFPYGADEQMELDSQEAEIAFLNEDFDGNDSIFMESDIRYRADVIAHLASAGPQFLQLLFEAENSRRFAMITKNSVPSDASLDGAFNSIQMFPFDDPKDSQNPQELEFEGDEIYTPNLAWHWSYRQWPRRRCFELQNADLRQWGYVFWDKARLDGLGILKEPRPEHSARSLPSSYQLRVHRPSVQKRLWEKYLESKGS